ncbi:MAG: glycosyltransferase family 2 protein, partial [Candidatus Omnitrophica bacterium]|nr:glycosyltransferase family 2 protein [Candidatus Omnitrophota bacterium]
MDGIVAQPGPDAAAGVFLSLVIPTYNDAQRIAQTLEVVTGFLARQGRLFEVLVVNDGSDDQTVAAVRAYAGTHAEVRLITLPRNQGKGAAVRAGVLAAGGEVVCFCDADLAIPITHLEGLVSRLRQGADVVIASRALAQSSMLVPQDPLRWMMSRAFNLVVRTAFGMPYGDTQCGFKGFRREAARAIFARARIDGFAFDVELLLIARALGQTVVEMPVDVANSRLTTVSLAAHAGRIWRDLWQIHRTLR